MESNIKINSLQEQIDFLLEEGEELLQNNKIKKAFKKFDAALNLNSNYPKTYLVKGEAHIEMYEMDKAEECMYKYLTFFPDDKRAYLNLIKINDERGYFEKALYYCDKLLNMESKNYKLHFKKADILNMLGNEEEALYYCNNCLKLNPYFYKALCLKGSLLNSLENYKEALDSCSKAISLDSSKSEAYFEKSLIYENMKNFSEAFSFAKKAYELSPNDELYRFQYVMMKEMIRW
ncbi:tetratricopeptide repeat protein [Clostridium cochlearium]|uniref:Tetratricopeptide repeat-containing protein n=1 Tax=Clostridium cochlearium TaxID=1494 RepID=A0ABY0QLL6_CLOCO|nr:hypothetical protein [Clostridium cochlearium]MBE6064929.1 hypothetical protein [Clostridium cochlearium]MBU5270274.1 hypothetical protein [Clostridium cochlearium]SDL17179.1 Tetratricopeptide repeat-containing protein [Clostridium cochlearium]SNV82667.1 TPR repeat-containing protein [Clostridium cochlearium]STA93037.1 TPR repeat-containing protein [Clostridium cochlearium]